MSSNLRINNESLLQVNPDIIDSEIDDEMVMMNIDTGDYFGLNTVASQVWMRLKEPKRLDTLIQILQDEYDVASEQCIADVMPLLEKMHEAKLLQIS